MLRNMLSSAIQNRIPSLRRTISDYALRPSSKTADTETVVHRRAESTDVIFSQKQLEILEHSPEFKGKLSVHGTSFSISVFLFLLEHCHRLETMRQNIFRG